MQGKFANYEPSDYYMYYHI